MMRFDPSEADKPPTMAPSAVPTPGRITDPIAAPAAAPAEDETLVTTFFVVDLYNIKTCRFTVLECSPRTCHTF